MKALLDWKHLSFAYPWYFTLLLLIPFVAWWYFYAGWKNAPRLRLSDTTGITAVKPSLKVRMRPALLALRAVALLLLILALARPQSTNVTESINSEGIDIVLALDVSGSMLAEDLKPNRIEAAKKVALNFVDQRPGDRIGLVIFSGESFTQCPVTIDHDVLKTQLNQVTSGMLEDGTAMGDGLATAVDRLRSAKGKSKVVVLLTDGVNNRGKIGPETALDIAKVYQVRVYTIGAGSKTQALTPVSTEKGAQKVMMDVAIDEPLLRKIAAETGGRYFRATNNQSLAQIYQEIDKLEKTKQEVNTFKHYTELFFPFAYAAIICLIAEMILRYAYFRSIT
jgi:Ca-activated chloride channel family protein